MPLITIQSAEGLPQKGNLPVASIAAKGSVAAETVLGYDAAANVIRALVEFPIPQDDQVQERKGKKDKEGNQNVTSRTYGKARKVEIPLADGEGNRMRITALLEAPVAGAEEDEEETV